jgi:hypothetical protein
MGSLESSLYLAPLNTVQFTDYANEIESVSAYNSKSVLLELKSLSASITSYALDSNSSWPMVTVPHIEIRGERMRGLTGASAVAISPLVTNLEAWNEYAVESQGWIQESYYLRGEEQPASRIPPGMFSRPIDEDGGTKTRVDSPNQAALYSPLWQLSAAPHDVSIINFNLMSDEIFSKLLRIMISSRTPVLSEVFDPSTILGGGALADYGDGKFHPHSVIVKPIHKGFKNTSDIVGSIILAVPWDEYFTNILHQGAHKILCVMRDTCGGVFTYHLNGPQVTFVGHGDHHDSRYDYLEHTVPFGPPSDKYVYGQDDDADAHCRYSLHIYPTVELQESYETNRPALFASVVVLVFVFTSFIFLMYDFLVQRRQDRVQSAAVRSNAIVSSLFPAEVRDRLFSHNDTSLNGAKRLAKTGSKSYETAPKFRLKNYLDSTHNPSTGVSPPDDDGVDNTDSMGVPEMYDTKPIADFFPNTTVMFADIAGFTAWSSVREPSQVFTLLETVFRAFDAIAKRRRVFKVETVGDCYVSW